MREGREGYPYELGERISYPTWAHLRSAALRLSSEGYGVAVIGFADISENVLTIMAVPEEEE